jgi:hypothetical protein
MPSSALAVFVYDGFPTIEFRVVVDPDTNRPGMSRLSVDVERVEIPNPITEELVCHDPGRRSVTAHDLRAISLPALLERAIEDLTTTLVDDTGPRWRPGEGGIDAGEAQAIRQRREHGPDLLERVAAIYRETDGRKAADAIAAELMMSDKQAYRLIAKARDGGYLPPSTRRSSKTDPAPQPSKGSGRKQPPTPKARKR